MKMGSFWLVFAGEQIFLLEYSFRNGRDCLEIWLWTVTVSVVVSFALSLCNLIQKRGVCVCSWSTNALPLRPPLRDTRTADREEHVDLTLSSTYRGTFNSSDQIQCLYHVNYPLNLTITVCLSSQLWKHNLLSYSLIFRSSKYKYVKRLEITVHSFV